MDAAPLPAPTASESFPKAPSESGRALPPPTSFPPVNAPAFVVPNLVLDDCCVLAFDADGFDGFDGFDALGAGAAVMLVVEVMGGFDWRMVLLSSSICL